MGCREYNGVIPSRSSRGGEDMARAKTYQVGRDSKTGGFITVAAAKRRPNTTTVETIKKKK